MGRFGTNVDRARAGRVQGRNTTGGILTSGVLIGGRRCRVLGVIAMDQMVVDLGQEPTVDREMT